MRLVDMASNGYVLVRPFYPVQEQYGPPHVQTPFQEPTSLTGSKLRSSPTTQWPRGEWPWSWEI